MASRPRVQRGAKHVRVDRRHPSSVACAGRCACARTGGTAPHASVELRPQDPPGEAPRRHDAVPGRGQFVLRRRIEAAARATRLDALSSPRLSELQSLQRDAALRPRFSPLGRFVQSCVRPPFGLEHGTWSPAGTTRRRTFHRRPVGLGAGAATPLTAATGECSNDPSPARILSPGSTSPRICPHAARRHRSCFPRRPPPAHATSAASRPPRGTSTSAACASDQGRTGRSALPSGAGSRALTSARGRVEWFVAWTLDCATFAFAKHHVVFASPAAWTGMMSVPVPEGAPCAPAAARLRCAASQTTRCAVGGRCSTSSSPHSVPAEWWRGRSRAGAEPESPPPESASPLPRCSSYSACATLRPLRPERRSALSGVAGSTTTRIPRASVTTTSCAPRPH